jgi:hypothetical protein
MEELPLQRDSSSLIMEQYDDNTMVDSAMNQHIRGAAEYTDASCHELIRAGGKSTA